ncbi:hypothetical protein JOE49_003638 [Paenibacillus sp. PvR133]|jgi:hypothetical protein|nr:hypothetical protein [Paenibacillus sp. PvR133]
MDYTRIIGSHVSVELTDAGFWKSGFAAAGALLLGITVS